MKLFERNCTVYCILNIQTNERYVGSTVNFSSRKNQHISDLRLHKHRSWKLQKGFDEWGENNFVFIKLEEFVTMNEEYLYSREQWWMDKFLPEYNISLIAGKVITNFTSEARERARVAKIGRKQSQEEKDKRAKSIKEYWKSHPPIVLSEEKKAHLRKLNTGSGNPNWGKKRTPEQLENMSRGRANIKYTFKSPIGEVVEITNLIKNSFPVMGISHSSARKLKSGEYKQCHGWTFVTSEKI